MIKKLTKHLAFSAIAILVCQTQVQAQSKSSDKKQYRGFATKINDMVHTKLEASFDFEKAQLRGKVWLTLKPHFYPTDSLLLDAKGMEILSVDLVDAKQNNIPLKYTYNDVELNIKLNKTFTSNDTYVIYINYISKPNEGKFTGSAAITDAKGLYFINPKGEDKEKPTQIWTQGETESNSVWIPIIDKPNQKTTQEIYMTLPQNFVTLSNGVLVSSKKNNDGTKTDYWKMNEPHAPYLMFMGAGEFEVVKDSYEGKEVNYYVEKPYKQVAKQIFGNTPEMMKCFSKLTGVNFPWVKYSQMVARDYVSGAMENTTATLHMERAQQNARELTDGNDWESTIAHELFHQWFGDYVTAESWSHLTVNESFANYSEVLWAEYKYGKDAGDAQNTEDLEKYLSSNSFNKVLVRNYYTDKEEVFDRVTYEKGGRILHMLRNYLGDSAFFKALNVYLSTNKFGNGNAHKLRLAFEAVSGRDLNWFFNQWYFNNGHPKLQINYAYNETTKLAKVIVEQKQPEDKLFKMPVYIDVYVGNNKQRHKVWIENKQDSFEFSVDAKPDLINFDGDKVLLCEKQDNHTAAEFYTMYTKAAKFKDRYEAIDYAARNKQQKQAFDILTKAINDPYADLRKEALSSFDDTVLNASLTKQVYQIANTEGNKRVKAQAIKLLAKQNNMDYKPIFLSACFDSSYTVAGEALLALSQIDEAKAKELLPQLKQDAKKKLKTAIESIEILTKTDADYDDVIKTFMKKNVMAKFDMLPSLVKYLGNVNNTDNFKKGLNMVVKIRDQWSAFVPNLKLMMNKAIKELIVKKEAAKKQGIPDMDEHIKLINDKTKDTEE